MQSFKQALVASFVTLAILALGTACQSTNSTANVSDSLASQPSNGLKIAYVELDSVLNNYEQYTEMKATLEKKSNDSRASLSAKMNNLQRAGASFQQKLQSNQFATREAAEAEQARLMKMQQELESLNASLTEQLMKEQEAAEEKLYKTIKEEIAKMNKDWGFDLILSNVKADNILYAADGLDITGRVIEELNKAYKKEAPEATPKKEEAKK